jgi:GT2 family glycosyltransferase
MIDRQAPGETYPPSSMRVSVVVCTRDRRECLERCLTALTACSVVPFEIIVVDNAPRISPAADVARAYGARYVIESRVGLSRARNAGARAATGDVVAFIDDDAAADCEWLASLTAAFADANVGVVAGDILSMSGDPDPGAYRVGARRALRRTDSHWFEIASFGGVGNGGNMAFRREALLQAGGFDARLGIGAPLPGCEEHEAFMRVVEAGYTAVSDPAAIVFHDSGTRDPQQRAAAQYAVAAPYMAFLLMEKRGYRGRVARYAVEALFGKRRHWRVPSRAPLLTLRQRVVAALTVPAVAWRAFVRSGSTATAAPIR